MGFVPGEDPSLDPCDRIFAAIGTAHDLAIALVEILGAVDDVISYYQEQIGGEAYLGTARIRRSVRGLPG